MRTVIGSAQSSQGFLDSAKQLEMSRLCADIDEAESHTVGGHARSCIVAAMHFDFHTAMGQTSHSDAFMKYREEATNIQILNNVLRNLKDLKSGLGTTLNETQAREKQL